MDWNPENFYVIKEDKEKIEKIEKIINSNENYANYFREVIPYIKKHFKESNVFLSLCTFIDGEEKISFRMPGGDPDPDGEEIVEFYNDLEYKPWSLMEDDVPWYMRVKYEIEYRTLYDKYLAGECDDFEF